MCVTLEQKRPDRWIARVRLETDGAWRCFQATGESRVGALIALRAAMWRYRGADYDAARRAVVAAAVSDDAMESWEREISREREAEAPTRAPAGLTLPSLRAPVGLPGAVPLDDFDVVTV